VSKAARSGSVRRRSAGRFAVGVPEGSRSSVWRIWTHDNEVYLSARALTSILKISLHSSGDWRHAFTAEQVVAGLPFITPGQTRAIDRWERPPEFWPGVTKAFEIVVPSSEVTTPSHPKANELFRRNLGAKKVVWVPAAPEGYATHFTVLFTKPEVTAATLPGWPGRDAMGTRLIWKTELPNAETVWIVSHEPPDTFQQWVAEGKRYLISVASSAVWEEAAANGLELRILSCGYNYQDGTRVYLDISGRLTRLAGRFCLSIHSTSGKINSRKSACPRSNTFELPG
jgi:hypothetical protein